jgi:hypothetical protein
MTLGLVCMALRQRPFTASATALLVLALAAVLGASAPFGILVWLGATVIVLEIWAGVEPLVLRRRGFRSTLHTEGERIRAALQCSHIEVLIQDDAAFWIGRGLRCLVVSRGALDLLEDRALPAMLHQAAAPRRGAAMAGQLLVWVGALPMFCGWRMSQFIETLARQLATIVGNALLVPMIVCPTGFVRWAGRFIGAAFIGLLGASLLSGGLTAAGLLLLGGWALVPAGSAVFAWETRRIERAADQATVAAGLGWQLLEALETLAEAGPPAKPEGLLAVFCPTGAPLADRAQRIRRALSESAT